MKADVLPTCHSFSDPEYLTAGVWFFEDISNTEQKPDKLAGKKVQFARLLCEAGRSETEGLNFCKQYLFYVNMTDQELELSMRGVLLNGGGEVQGATPWKTGVDQADTAKEAAHAATADSATNADNATNAQEAAHATNADNATNATTAGTATNAGYAGNSAMLGGVAANKYALKSEVGVPIAGEVRMFALDTPPEGWLKCDGAEITADQYPRLYSAIGFKFDPEGARCLLPNMAGKYVMGTDAENAVGSNIEEQLPNIKGEWEAYYMPPYPNMKGCFGKGYHNDVGGNYGLDNSYSVTFNANKTLNPADGKTIDNPAYKDPIDGTPIEVKTRNFSIKKWVRKF